MLSTKICENCGWKSVVLVKYAKKVCPKCGTLYKAKTSKKK